VFSPVEIRNPASSLPTSKSKAKAKMLGKESSSNSKKGKKKASVGAGGIEEVAGSLGIGVSKSLALVDQDPVVETGPITRSRAAGNNTDKVAQDDNDDEMYATEEDDAEEGRVGGTLEENVGGEECVGDGATDLTTTSTTVVQPDMPPTASGTLMAIDPALEAFHVPSNQPTPPDNPRAPT
jgi:hypothetical protein